MQKDEFELILPVKKELKIDVTDPALYKYDFNAYSLVPLQQDAGLLLADKIKETIIQNISNIKLVKESMQPKQAQFVATLTKTLQKKLTSGELSIAKRKSGDTYSQLINSKTHRIAGTFKLKKEVIKEVGNGVELAAIQSQLAALADQIEELNHGMELVTQGQYNDRYAGFFSARQQIIEALVSQDPFVRKSSFLNATKSANDSIAKLMLSIQTDVTEFLDPSIKPKTANAALGRFEQAFGYLNATIQLNLAAFTALGETQAMQAELANYRGFMTSTLLAEDENHKTTAWRVDNFQKGQTTLIEDQTANIINKISQILPQSKLALNQGEHHEEITDL